MTRHGGVRDVTSQTTSAYEATHFLVAVQESLHFLNFLRNAENKTLDLESVTILCIFIISTLISWKLFLFLIHK